MKMILKVSTIDRQHVFKKELVCLWLSVLLYNFNMR